MEKLTVRRWAQTMWQPSTWNKSTLVTRVKSHANGRNIDGQLLPKLLDVTGSVCLHTLLHVAACRLRVVGSCCERVGNRSTFDTTPQLCWKSCANGYNICCATFWWSRNKGNVRILTFLLFRDRQNVPNTCIRLHSSFNNVGATRAHYKWFTKSYSFYPSHDALQAQQCW